VSRDWPTQHGNQKLQLQACWLSLIFVLPVLRLLLWTIREYSQEKMESMTYGLKVLNSTKKEETSASLHNSQRNVLAFGLEFSQFYSTMNSRFKNTFKDEKYLLNYSFKVKHILWISLDLFGGSYITRSVLGVKKKTTTTQQQPESESETESTRL